mmetsp:Transcript_57089/g.107587  ORF Transcript_57089/g.107587 Transcript_57089/m.107587 type:complete len:175 (+) Transcript_57089:63-587(+)
MGIGTYSKVPGGYCCTSRRTPIRCENVQLRSRLAQLAVSKEAFDEVWLYCDPDLTEVMFDPPAASSNGALGTQPADRNHVIVYLYGTPPRSLRLEWRSDGLAFCEGRLGQYDLPGTARHKAGTRLKVFKKPVPAAKLLADLQRLESYVYDPVAFSSKRFCEMLFDIEDGEVEYS